MNKAYSVAPISKNELARGFIYCRDNSERLIKDAEILYNYGSYLSAISNCRLGNEETAKALMIWSASTYKDDELDKWDWFYRSLFDHKEKLRVLEYQLHWESYEDKDKFHEIIGNLMRTREHTIYVGFNEYDGTFNMPGEFFDDLPETSRIELTYSQKIHQLVFLVEYLTGKSTVEQIVDAFNVNFHQET